MRMRIDLEHAMQMLKLGNKQASGFFWYLGSDDEDDKINTRSTEFAIVWLKPLGSPAETIVAPSRKALITFHYEHEYACEDVEFTVNSTRRRIIYDTDSENTMAANLRFDYVREYRHWQRTPEEAEAENLLELVLRQAGYSRSNSIRVGIKLDADGMASMDSTIKIPESMTRRDSQALSLESMFHVDLHSHRLNQSNRSKLEQYALKPPSNEWELEANSRGIEWMDQAAEGRRCLGMIGIKGDDFLDKICPKRSYNEVDHDGTEGDEGDFRALEPITFDPGYIEKHLVQSEYCPWTTLWKLRFFRNVSEHNCVDALNRRNKLFPPAEYRMSEAEKHLVDQSLLVQSIKALREAAEYVEYRLQGLISEVSMRTQAQADLDRWPVRLSTLKFE
ncbi:hypothetical protein SBOR_5673 [Sclerotinia borealis F-4128]|uniref:Uncharacterized protein n=1 Tax=Sclerotinia borealis (strain F-4128) TaxID=1432307 RepID=W9CHF9_SCLBF|nr:hypothetical protein SBOR_5673 [Sclerotinia borealis F-4128]